jgi:hypothetical protein
MSSQFQLDTWRVAGSGHWLIAVAGEVITDRDAVRIGANGRIWRCDADSIATMPCMGIAITAASAAGANVSVFLQGPVEIPGSAWVLGGKIYVDTNTGGLTQTAPAGIGELVQEVGFALNATQIYFNPQLGGGALSLLDYELQTGIIAEPTITSKGNGHTVIVHNETEERDFIWSRTDLDTKWSGVELL